MPEGIIFTSLHCFVRFYVSGPITNGTLLHLLAQPPWKLRINNLRQSFQIRRAKQKWMKQKEKNLSSRIFETSNWISNIYSSHQN